MQALPSLHGVLLSSVGFVHMPVLVLHVPWPWHWSEAVQTPGAQAPVADEHVAHPEHAFPVFCQVPLASQVCGWEPLHRLDPYVHSPVQPAVILQAYRQVCATGTAQVPALHLPAA